MRKSQFCKNKSMLKFVYKESAIVQEITAIKRSQVSWTSSSYYEKLSGIGKTLPITGIRVQKCKLVSRMLLGENGTRDPCPTWYLKGLIIHDLLLYVQILRGCSG